MHWFLDPIKNHYVDFKGRASRKAYWMFALYYLIFYVVLMVIDGVLGTNGTLALIFSLVVLLPSLAISFRRLHDIGKSAWWLLIGFIPILGTLVLLYFYIKPGEAGANAHGDNPLGATPAVESEAMTTPESPAAEDTNSAA